MAVITKKQIIERIRANDLVIKPEIDSFQLQEHAVDLRLGFTFMIPKTWSMTKLGRETLSLSNFDTANAHKFEVVELEEGQFFELMPGEYVLSSTLESLKIPNDLMAVLYPRSSTNRKGLSLDLTGVIDAGYEGQLVLPLRNNTSSQVVRIFPGERICQIVFEELKEPTGAYKGKYNKRDVIDGIKKEKQNESSLILKGKIKELKEKYPAIKKK
ncbi:MAG: dCTP deaminase [Candidatus Paceibacterota bacterium]|jgi:dCTP deaminase